MGDMADYYGELAYDHEFDEVEEDEEEPANIRKFNGRCKFCRKKGFHWHKTDKGWRLATATGKIHSCVAWKKAKDKLQGTKI